MKKSYFCGMTGLRAAFLVFFAGLLTTGCFRGSYAGEKSRLNGLLYSSPLVKKVLDSFDRYEAQIIYTQIDRDRANRPHFKSLRWNYRPLHYFYPASVVKLPVALLAAEKIKRLQAGHPALDLFTAMRADSARPPQSAFSEDASAWNGQASVGHFIKKIFLVSDNDAFNRLYEFTGQAYIHERLRSLGFHKTHIIHRLSAPEFDLDANRYTNPVHFFEEDLRIYDQAEQYNPAEVRVPDLGSLLKGQAHYAGDSLVHAPFDFSAKNFFSLGDMEQMIRAIVFHEYMPEGLRFDLDPDQRRYLLKCMSQLPSESRFPRYDSTYHDGFCKFFMYGDSKERIPDHLRIFNKVGWAYGYLTDVAYIVDFKNKIEFILAATVNANTDGVVNDGLYDYENLGLPYLSRLGKLFYSYEQSRERRHAPDLSSLIFDYRE
ncbi:MAG TPA: serine hydrolase [Saprospiraceae bacterium]|nr:serine hydrolase [Saprospiraceae bacterium]HNT20374.1 serine hydrolase [Saprospiraceae bacterium]